MQEAHLPASSRLQSLQGAPETSRLCSTRICSRRAIPRAKRANSLARAIRVFPVCRQLRALSQSQRPQSPRRADEKTIRATSNPYAPEHLSRSTHLKICRHPAQPAPFHSSILKDAPPQNSASAPKAPEIPAQLPGTRCNSPDAPLVPPLATLPARRRDKPSPLRLQTRVVHFVP